MCHDVTNYGSELSSGTTNMTTDSSTFLSVVGGIPGMFYVLGMCV